MGGFDFTVITANWEFLAKGLRYTVQVTLFAMVGGIFLGTLLVVTVLTVRISDMVLDSRVGALDRTLGFLFGLGFDTAIGQCKAVERRAHLHGHRVAVDGAGPNRFAQLPARLDRDRARAGIAARAAAFAIGERQ